MRKIPILLFALLFSACSDRQDLAGQLQKKEWFVRGEFWERDHSATLSSDSSGKYEWSAIFHKGNRMSYSSFITESYIDTANVFHKKGEKFTDSTYSYSIKNNVLKVTKRNDSYFLRLIPKDTNVFEIVSVRESEFNN